MNKYQLNLNKIGKFQNTPYKLNDITVFYGPNEAGKTTIIDGIINSMVNFNKTNVIWKQTLGPRYPEGIDTSLVLESTNNDLKKIELNLAMNLLIVRASDLKINLEGEWLSAVKSKLFTGGINPKSIIERVDLMQTKPQKQNNSPLYEKKKIVKALNVLNEQLDEVKLNLKSLSSQIEEENRLKNENAESQTEFEKVKTELDVQKEKMSKLQTALEAKNIEGLYKKVKKKDELSVQLKNSRYTEQKHDEIKEVEKNIESLKNKNKILSDNLETEVNNLKNLKEKLGNEEANYKILKEKSNLAQTTHNSLELQISEIREKQSQKPIGKLVFASILFLAGIVMLITLEGQIKYLAFLPLLGGLAAFWSTLMSKNEDKDSITGIKATIKTFNQKYDEVEKCPSDYSEAMDFLRRIIKNYETSENSVRNLTDKIEPLKNKIDELKGDLEDIKYKYDDYITRLKELLPLGIESSDNYLKKLNEQTNLKKEIESINEELKIAISTYGVGSLEDIINLIEIKMKEITENPITLEVDKSKIKEEEKHRDYLQKRFDDLSGTLSLQREKLASTSTELQIKVGDNSINQVRLERKISTIKEEVDSKDLEMESFYLLRDIVQEISNDSNEQFEQLNKSINEYLKIILGDEKSVTFKNLKEIQTATCADHYGKQVFIDHLSSGTKDAFALASRLAFLKKVELHGDSFLILDDPFVFMDNERETNAIKAIKFFKDEVDIPIIFFTKNEKSKDKFEKEFSSAKVITLSR